MALMFCHVFTYSMLRVYGDLFDPLISPNHKNCHVCSTVSHPMSTTAIYNNLSSPLPTLSFLIFYKKYNDKMCYLSLVPYVIVPY